MMIDDYDQEAFHEDCIHLGPVEVDFSSIFLTVTFQYVAKHWHGE
jgi:hypothetical protein